MDSGGRILEGVTSVTITADVDHVVAIVTFIMPVLDIVAEDESEGHFNADTTASSVA